MSSPPAALDARQDTPGVPADHETTFRFLDLLFEGVAIGFVEFQYFLPGNKPKHADSPSFLSLPMDRDRLSSEVLSRSGQRLISFSPAPRFRVPSRCAAGKDHDVLEVGCIWASVEHRRAKGGVVEVLRRIRDYPLRPSVVVSTGLAHQVYFVLREPFRDDKLLKWSDLMLDLSTTLSAGAPPVISHVARLPGVVNLQEARPASCTVSAEYSSWMRYDVGEVTAALRTAGDQTSSATGVTGETPAPSITIGQLRRRGLSPEIIEAVVTGRKLAYAAGTPAAGSESGPDFRLAYSLFEKGFAENEIRQIFRSHPHGCGRKWARKRDGEKYLDSIIRKVSIRFQGTGRGVAAGGVQPADFDSSFSTGLPPGYARHEDGSVWFHSPVTDEGRKVPGPVKVCNSPIRIAEIHEHIDTGQISVVISFEYLGRTGSAAIPRSRMADARQLVIALSGVGAPITSLNARHITAYLEAYEHTFAPAIPRKRVTSRFGRGRSDGPFFFPGTSPGVEFSPLGPGDASLFRAYASRRGSLRGWLEAMAAVAGEGLMIPQVAVLTSFVPPLQRRLQIPNFILDLHGNTSTGKSTSLRMAASVYGRPVDPDSLVLQWMNTRAAIEQVAAVCSELPVFLDDAQHCPAELKKLVVYMIANGRGKGRGAWGGRGGISETPSWNTVALSTSEEPLHEASPHEGARGRILSIGGLTPPFRPGMASLIRDVDKAVADNHGHAGVAYLRHLNGFTELDWSRWRRRYAEVQHELVRGAASDLVGRVGGYIAAIQLAAEIASPLLGLPFRADVVGAWLKLHIDEQYSSHNAVLHTLRTLADYYVTNINRFAGDGHYDAGKRANLSGLSKRGEYVGFLRSVVDAIFKAHKWSQSAMLNKLTQAGALHATERDRHTKKVSVSGVHHRMICIKWSALLPDDHQTGEHAIKPVE